MKAPTIHSTRWQKFRRGILLRDGGRCRYRYPSCTEVATQVDHLVPRGRGGGLYDESNCYAVCHACHREKERRERAGEEVRFLGGEAPKTRQSSRIYTAKLTRQRRNLALAGDYSRSTPNGAS